MPSKPCTKCKRVLDYSCFSNGRNKTGKYPSCRECESDQRKRLMAAKPLCRKCRINNHTTCDWLCYPCQRIRRGIGLPKWNRRNSDLEWCKLCGERPSLSYHQYCLPCKNAYQNRTRSKKWRERHPDHLSRLKSNARAYATGLLATGKIKRGPCVFCGKPGRDFHHYDYEPRTRNFEDVCVRCHVYAHQFIKFLLTSYQNGAIRLSVA